MKQEEVASYYDILTKRKLRGFVEGNARVEQAWQRLCAWAEQPLRILEIGCGIGEICGRMKEHWPHAEVFGMDISPESVRIAETVFGKPGIHFVVGYLNELRSQKTLTGHFDLIVMMDVYEHISLESRPSLHQDIANLLSPRGMIFLSVPTPRKQDHLRAHQPQEIQPVDEDIRLSDILTLATETSREVLLYQEVDVWHQGDYAHAVLGNRPSLSPKPRNQRTKSFWEKLLPQKFSTAKRRNNHLIARLGTWE